MERVFDYIIFKIMMLQKINGIANKISKGNLEKIISMVINDLDVDKKEELLEKYDFDDEINRFIEYYFDYFYVDNDNICLEEDVSFKKIQSLICSRGIYDSIEEKILDSLECNLKVKELYGVVVRKDIYNCMHNLYNEVNELYNSKEELDIVALKRLLFKIGILNSNIENAIDICEIMDIQLYLQDKIEKKQKNLKFNIENYHFSNSELEEDPFFLSLLGKTDTEDDIMRYKNELLFTRSVEPLYKENIEEYSFYLKVYYLLSDEINNTKDSNIRKRLIKAKNNLMKAIDLIFNNTLFMNKDNSSSLIHNLDGVYYRQFYISGFFIDELLSYKDGDYLDDEVRFQNIIKKNFIKAYYELTKDRIIKDVIETSILDEEASISSNMLKEIIKSNNTRKKEK